jgi:hypothetical protein
MRGPLHTVQVLLGAESFSDLLNRYRYLRLMADYDQSLLGAVEEMEGALQAQSREVEESLAELNRLRQDQVTEVAELRQVEAQRQQTLSQFRSEEARTVSMLDQLEAQEGRLSGWSRTWSDAGWRPSGEPQKPVTRLEPPPSPSATWAPCPGLWRANWSTASVWNGVPTERFCAGTA